MIVLLIAAISIWLIQSFKLYRYRLLSVALPLAISLLWGIFVLPDAGTLEDIGWTLGPSAILAPLFTWLWFRRRASQSEGREI